MQQNQAKWIWYPGDYEIYHSLLLHGRRDERDWRHPAFWRLDDCWHNVSFYREFSLESPVEIEVKINGTGHLTMDDIPAPCGKFTIPAGTHWLRIWVYKPGGLPCAWVSGRGLDSGEGWLAGCHDGEFLPAGWSEWYAAPDSDPEKFPFAYEQLRPVSCQKDGKSTLYDFGKETFAQLQVKTGSKPVFFCYGESREEAMDSVNAVIREEVPAFTETTLQARAFRYLRVDDETGETGFQAMYEYLPLERRGTFRCSDETLNQIWEVCAYTFHLNSREFFLDGIKRDRWVWSGDAYQSYLVNDYLFRDEAITRRTILALRGKDPVKTHINTIQDYSFYWLMSVGERYRRTGDLSFVRGLWPAMKSLMEFCLSRTDEEGFVVERPGDWVFIDWADLDKKGGHCIEQMLLVRSLETMAEMAVLLAEDGSRYTQLADALREKVEQLYWDEEKGAYLDSFRSGRRFVSRNTNLFALRYGFDRDGRRESIIQNVLLNDEVAPIITPYFKFYEMEAWCEMGKLNFVREQIDAYWGGMLRLGATSIWEAFDPREEGAAHYAMYGQPFGKSLCHAWGASPIYLLGKYFLGVDASADGFTVRPELGGLEWMEGTVPVQGGTVRIRLDGEFLKVETDAAGGVLLWKGQQISLSAGNPVELAINK